MSIDESGLPDATPNVPFTVGVMGDTKGKLWVKIELVYGGERNGQRNGEWYPERQMFRVLHRQIARFLNWVNRTGSGSSASRAVREAEDHRRNVESRDWF